ncbi:MAG: response regulator transcription factor [Chloroflexi bacterium]|nr:response regulator transcription factor [Chloroflexota bacterium]
MTDDGSNRTTILVISDDPEMARLISLNLRRRGFAVEQADLLHTRSDRWTPVRQRPDLIILNLENPERISPAEIQDLSARPWAKTAPFILVAESPPLWQALASLHSRVTVMRGTDIGAILSTARTLLRGPSPSSSLAPAIILPGDATDGPRPE